MLLTFQKTPISCAIPVMATPLRCEELSVALGLLLFSVAVLITQVFPIRHFSCYLSISHWSRLKS